ncbi:PLP-dependent cysteine synthase family protein [Pseudomonas oryzihabitans]|uniref:PLP-dependent cysteine synthase family protein n=1 Tax=Pseudomonas oryzihabitans TaxID=47885 RepID=UPI0005A7500F|nr:cysteine synthase family protein [Pseudomonas oryzihabitans]NMZ44232.1 cysteine synthase family protein [Pseudomonas oryzihabitans]
MNSFRDRSGILGCVGNTPLVELSNKIVPRTGARIFAKLELANPTGSMKDRMALAMIEEAEKRGALKVGDKVVEYSSGSTGTSLAQICSLKGYPLRIVTSDAFSAEKLNHMRALGAELVLIDSNGGGITKELFTEMIEHTRALSQESGVYWTDQMNNHDMLVGYQRLGQEILEQTDGKIGAFVHGVGTCGSLRGVSKELVKYNPDVVIGAVEPKESPVLSGGNGGGHSIEGIGAGYLVHHWDQSLAQKIFSISTSEAFAMSRELARTEAIFAGPSSGANVCAALQLAQTLPPDVIVVTILCDSGFKYLSTPLYRFSC